MLATVSLGGMNQKYERKEWGQLLPLTDIFPVVKTYPGSNSASQALPEKEWIDEILKRKRN